MKHLKTHKELGLHTESEVFEYMIKNLKPSNTLWSYFVNWDKVIANTKEIEVTLNILNYLIGKEDFDNEFKNLIKKHPEIVEVLPSLIVRDGKNAKKFKILTNIKNKRLIYEDFDFTKAEHNDEDIEKYLTFVVKTGLKQIIVDKNVKNLVDYMFGIEAGLDSNGRKNRSGHSMEDIVEEFVNDICHENDYEYLREADSAKIEKTWGINIPVDKASRRYDFVINHKGRLFIIETNFYSGGGSKLSAIAGDYRNLQNTLDDKFTFIWITDGPGWKTASSSLYETIKNNDHVLTLEMLESEALDEILKTTQTG